MIQKRRRRQTQALYEEATLGVFVGSRYLEAVLLVKAEAGLRIVDSHAVPIESERPPEPGEAAPFVPAAEPAVGLDVFMQVGTNPERRDMFLPAEFDPARSVQARTSPQRRHASVTAPTAPSIEAPFRYALRRCAELGYERPNVAFCVGEPYVSYRELEVRGATTTAGLGVAALKSWTAGRRPASEGGVSRRLLNLLRERGGGDVTEDRVAFQEMTPRGDGSRYLAHRAMAGEPVAALMGRFRLQGEAPFEVQSLQTDVACYSELVHTVVTPGGDEMVAVLHLDAEGVQILFFEEDRLRHREVLPSLSAADTAEVVSRRLMLLQDAQRIRALNWIIVTSDREQLSLLHRLKDCYPNAVVTSAGVVMAERGVELAESRLHTLAPASVLAITVAQRALVAPPPEGRQTAVVNLLPYEYRAARMGRRLAWHTMASIVLFLAVFFGFTWRYMEARSAAYYQGLAVATVPELVEPVILQTHVDSLEGLQSGLTVRGQLLDSLVRGSDRWSRGIEVTFLAARDLKGLWITAWKPGDENIRVEGNARSAQEVATFAGRLGGRVISMSTAHIRNQTVYPFIIELTLDDKAIPRVEEAYQYGGATAPGGAGDVKTS